MTRRLRWHTTFLVWSAGITWVMAQEPTDLYLLQLHSSSDGRYHVYQPAFLSGFNPGGYTNQPWFTPEGDLLVSVRKKGEMQNDIYALSPAKKTIRRLTQTKSNEYSPRMHPDGRRLTVLRQIEGDSINQQVCEIPMQGSVYRSLTAGIRNVGYYTWLGQETLALYRIEGEDNRLAILSLKDQKTRRITSSVGRSLHTDGQGSLLYVHKFPADYWTIKKYNPSSSMIDLVVETPAKAEDFVVAPDGTYFIGKGSRLLYFRPGFHTSWQEAADLSIYGISQITRLAVSPDGRQLALVSDKPVD